jgi:hypothetical protein
VLGLIRSDYNSAFQSQPSPVDLVNSEQTISSSEPTIYSYFLPWFRTWGPSSSGSAEPRNVFPELFRAGRNEDHVSKNFERWKELAAQCLGEQDPAKLTELATEMNLVLNQKTQNLDPPQYTTTASHL